MCHDILGISEQVTDRVKFRPYVGTLSHERAHERPRAQTIFFPVRKSSSSVRADIFGARLNLRSI